MGLDDIGLRLVFILWHQTYVIKQVFLYKSIIQKIVLLKNKPDGLRPSDLAIFFLIKCTMTHKTLNFPSIYPIFLGGTIACFDKPVLKKIRQKFIIKEMIWLQAIRIWKRDVGVSLLLFIIVNIIYRIYFNPDHHFSQIQS